MRPGTTPDGGNERIRPSARSSSGWSGRAPGRGTVLDVGCGTGHFAAWLERRRHRVVGLERSPAMLAELHRWQPRLPVVLGDGHMLPFRDGAVM